MDKNSFVSHLVRDLKPVQVVKPVRYQVGWIIFSVLVLLFLSVSYFHLRPHMAVKLQQGFFVLPLGFMVLSGVSFVMASVLSSHPGRQIRRWQNLAFGSVGASVAVVFVQGLLMHQGLLLEMFSEAGTSWICASIITLIACFSLVGWLWQTRRAFFCRPVLSAFLAAGMSVVMAGVGIMLICPAEHFSHLFFWHMVPQVCVFFLASIVLKFLVSRH